MSDQSESCLVEKLSHYIDLDETAHEHLAGLQEREKPFSRQQEIVGAGEEMKHLYVVKKGWCYSYIDMADGRRQIVRIHHPGDIIGFPDIAFDDATSSVCAAEDVVLCEFPRSKLDVIFEESPRLTALLFTLANRELATTYDLLRATGRMRAKERLAYLFLDLISRLRITNSSMTDTFRLPLNQQEIGDMLGLTHTYVSKTIREMEIDGFISRSDNTVTLKRESELSSMIDFIDRYENLNIDWFPS